MMKKFIIAALLVTAVISTAFCGGQKESGSGESAEPDLVISRWAGPHADDQKKVVAEYSAANVIVDDIDYGNLKQKQVLSLSSSADYDLVWVHPNWMPEYVEKGWLVPLDNYLAERNVDLSAYSKGMLNCDIIDGKLYGLPTFAQCLIIAYNTEWFERENQKPPKTVDELVAVAKYFKEKGTGIAIPAKQGQASADLFAQLLFSAGGDYFDASGRANMASKEAIYAAELYDTLCKYSITGSTTWHYDNVSSAVREEKAPFGIAVTGLAFLDSDPEQSRIVGKVGYIPIPGKESLVGQFGIWSWSVAANSKNIDAAVDFALWLTGAEAEKKQALMNCQISAVTALASDPEVTSKIPFLPAANATMANGKTQPTSVSSIALFDPLIAALSEIATTDNAPADVMKRLQNQVKDVTE